MALSLCISTQICTVLRNTVTIDWHSYLLCLLFKVLEAVLGNRIGRSHKEVHLLLAWKLKTLRTIGWISHKSCFWIVTNCFLLAAELILLKL